MDIAMESSSISAKMPASTPWIGGNYRVALGKSIEELIDQSENVASDFSSLKLRFFDLMQVQVDPPLEPIWVYCALSFRSDFSVKGESLDRVSLVRKMFNFISACSASCSSSKSVALLAPLVLEVYAIVRDIREKDSSFETVKNVMGAVESFVGGILGYIGVCRLKHQERNAEEGTTDSVSGLVRIWMNDRFDWKGEPERWLEVFFPLVSEEIRGRLKEEELEIGYLAGVVEVEFFLLRLCLKFNCGHSRERLQKDLRTWAVNSITGLQSYYFFDILVRMLVEPNLPVSPLLNSVDEMSLQKILYDAVILVEYSFLKYERVLEAPGEHMKSLALTRLIVTHEAVEFFRKNGDQTKAISCINAFSSSSLPSQLIKLVTVQSRSVGNEIRPDGSSPKAFLKWLIGLEDQGIRIFDDSISKLHPKLVLDISDHHQPLHWDGDNQIDSSLLFYINKMGDDKDDNMEKEKVNDSASNVFIAASHTMKNEYYQDEVGRCVAKKKKVKFLKYDLHDISDLRTKNNSVSDDGGSSTSGSEVENPLSDDEMEVHKSKKKRKC